MFYLRPILRYNFGPLLNKSLQKMKQTELALSRLLRYKTLLLVLVKAANVSLD